MDWMSRFRGTGYAERTDPADETVINGAPFDARNTSRSGPESLAPPGDREVTLAEEIKRRQISAVVRYVAAVRAR